jgi:hypothetical protein
VVGSLAVAHRQQHKLLGTPKESAHAPKRAVAAASRRPATPHAHMYCWGTQAHAQLSSARLSSSKGPPAQQAPHGGPLAHRPPASQAQPSSRSLSCWGAAHNSWHTPQAVLQAIPAANTPHHAGHPAGGRKGSTSSPGQHPRMLYRPGLSPEHPCLAALPLTHTCTPPRAQLASHTGPDRSSVPGVTKQSREGPPAGSSCLVQGPCHHPVARCQQGVRMWDRCRGVLLQPTGGAMTPGDACTSCTLVPASPAPTQQGPVPACAELPEPCLSAMPHNACMQHALSPRDRQHHRVQQPSGCGRCAGRHQPSPWPARGERPKRGAVPHKAVMTGTSMLAAQQLALKAHTCVWVPSPHTQQGQQGCPLGQLGRSACRLSLVFLPSRQPGMGGPPGSILLASTTTRKHTGIAQAADCSQTVHTGSAATCQVATQGGHTRPQLGATGVFQCPARSRAQRCGHE